MNGSGTSTVTVIPGLQPATYQSHALHSSQCAWTEKNCYVDVWIEVLHALGLDPMAMLPVVLAVDFEGDQWTFFKPSLGELNELYGVDVQEMTVWRPLPDHAVEHLGAGKLISTEADSFWLPDTAGTDYREQHTKTTIVLAMIDQATRRCGYFHNSSYHELGGEDFAGVLRTTADPNDVLPLFAELVRLDRVVRHPGPALRAISRRLAEKHFARRPATNPIVRFHARFDQDLPDITERGLAAYHQWAFATTRQLGAAFELASQYLTWLEAPGDTQFAEPAELFNRISTGAKSLILKTARAVNSRRPVEMAPVFDAMAGAWDEGMASLGAVLQQRAR